jgi:hypothetical protein
MNDVDSGGGTREARLVDSPVNGYRQIILFWENILNKEPEIPEYLINYSGICVRRYSKEDYQYYIQHIKPNQFR